MRRSSRLRKKKKVDYSFGGLWNNMIKRAGTTWNEVVDILEDRSALPKRKAKPKPPKPKAFQPVQKFRRKLPAKPKGPKRDVPCGRSPPENRAGRAED